MKPQRRVKVREMYPVYCDECGKRIRPDDTNHYHMDEFRPTSAAADRLLRFEQGR